MHINILGYMVTILAVSDEEESLLLGQPIQENHDGIISLISKKENKKIGFDGKIDMLISCGDLRPKYLESLIDKYMPPIRLMVHGNHDMQYVDQEDIIDMDYSDVYRGMYVIQNDIKVVKNKHILSQPLTIGGYSGAMATGDRPFFFNRKQVQKFVRNLKIKRFLTNFQEIDIMMSHHPPYIPDMPSVSAYHKPSKVLGGIISEFFPKLWLYGHIHPKYTSQPLDHIFNGTNLINAVPYAIIEYDEENHIVKKVYK
jgi:uncharacterized protein